MIAMIAVAAAWSFNKNNSKVTLSDLTLKNIEALAEGEGGGSTSGGSGIALCSFYGCKCYFEYVCTVYSSTWGTILMTCPDMRG